ncbi:MAG: carboxyl transferase domain-containing protein, partial [Dehalococcoidia bacterium]|nr:carboxyl transferase domain-containing protein [Dehalococcoidia bacterium]
LLSYLPSNNLDDTPVELSTDPIDRKITDIRDIVPEDADRPYDIRDVIERIVDEASFLETHERFAPNIVVGFARIEGKAVGIVGNQPLYLAGVLDIDSSRKAARFVQFCDSFNLPVVTLVDVPGYLPGVSQEYGGIIGHGAKLVYAYAAATVPKVTLILRKGFGGAYDAMGSKHLGADINFAWAGSAIAVMAGTQAVNIINRRELANADNEEETRSELIQQYKDKLEHPYIAAGRGYIDDVIDPQESRLKIAQALRVLETKSEKGLSKKHGNIPL